MLRAETEARLHGFSSSSAIYHLCDVGQVIWSPCLSFPICKLGVITILTLHVCFED